MCTEKHKEFLKKALEEVKLWPEWRRASFGLVWRDRNPEKFKNGEITDKKS